MSRKKLRDADLHLWSQVAESVTPLTSKKAQYHIDSPKETRDEPKQMRTTTAPAKTPIAPFKIGDATKSQASYTFAMQLPEQLGHAPVRMDHKTYKSMRKGKLAPEGRLDLHGLRVDQAKTALNAFILSSQKQGKRLVLVITGKGRMDDDSGPIPRRVGVLRHEVPRWLSQAPVSAWVLQVTPAAQKHGGHGAYYVYLRRT